MASSPQAEDVHPTKLFTASCLALLATSVSFAVVSAIMQPLKEEFILTNEQVGYIGGAQLWGFALAIFVFGPLCDVIGMRRLLRFALLGHFGSVVLFYFAQGYWMLIAGALSSSLGNGLVEAACNPLVATLYPGLKTEKLNHFHVWFPGGILIGGVAAALLDGAELSAWRLKLLLILAPAFAYGLLFTGQRFPATERLQSGVSPSEMVKATFLRPLFLLLLVCMTMTASVELGPGRWIPAVLGAAGISGVLVLAWTNGIMAVLRRFAGTAVHRLSPTGVLLGCAILSGLGLFWLSYAETTTMAFVSGTLFALGVSYFWPTMLGVVAERVPRGGALALAVMGGTGALTVGAVTTPWMGAYVDWTGHEKLDAAATASVLRVAADEFSLRARIAPGGLAHDLEVAVGEVREVLGDIEKSGGALPPTKTANALRKVILLGGRSDVARNARAILEPAESYGGRCSFRAVALLAIVLTAVFGVLYLSDRLRGGYRAEALERGQATVDS